MVKKKFSLSYNSGDEIVELIIRDISGAKIDTFKFSIKDFPKIVNIIERKYGISILKKRDKDLEWLKDEY